MSSLGPGKVVKMDEAELDEEESYALGFRVLGQSLGFRVWGLGFGNQQTTQALVPAMGSVKIL